MAKNRSNEYKVANSRLSKHLQNKPEVFRKFKTLTCFNDLDNITKKELFELLNSCDDYDLTAGFYFEDKCLVTFRKEYAAEWEERIKKETDALDAWEAKKKELEAELEKIAAIDAAAKPKKFENDDPEYELYMRLQKKFDGK